MPCTHKKYTLEDILLPNNARPVRYDIHLEPDLVACVFKGTETIEIQVSSPTTSLTLHAHELSIDPASVKLTPTADGSKVALEKVSYDLTAKQTVKFEFDGEITPGSYKFSCSFSGTLNDALAGFYRSKDKPFGKDEFLAVTQFEATDARRAFPCFDEPALKAVFGMKVTAPADRVAISNGVVTRCETSLCGTKKTWTFADSPKMSSYLVAVVVGRFDSVSQLGSNGVLTTIYTQVGKSHLGRFALNVGVKALEFFEKKFGIPYFGGSKLDHIAIPDFAAGAMEQTGCVTYRTAALLIDEKDSSLAMRQRVCQVVAHEISHQWFGNLATMQWWDGLWLNEGFASFCERLATDFIYPEFQVWEQFVANVQTAAFNLDALTTTHPVEVPSVTSDDINENFDHISYYKGNAVVRQAFMWLGEDVFFKALNHYLTKYSLGNAVTTGLWDSMSAVSGHDVAKVFRNWTACPGFPFIHVSQQGAGKLTLRSSRFQAPWAQNPNGWPRVEDFDNGAVGPAVFDALTKHHKKASGTEPAANETDSWNIPLSIVTPSGVSSLGVLMLDDGHGKRLDDSTRDAALASMADKVAAAPGASTWFQLNANRGSFFRTILDEELLGKLSGAAATPADRKAAPALSIMDRIGLVSDAGAAVTVGLTSYSALLKLLWAMRYETEYTVWAAMLEALSNLRDAADSIGGALADQVKAFARKLLAPVLENLGWSPKAGEAPNTALLRASVLRTAALAGDDSVVAECLKRFDAYAVDAGATNPIPADLKQLVYSTAGSYGGVERWNKLLALLKGTDSSEEQRRLMTGLGKAGNDAALLKRCLALALGEDGLIRAQDVPFILGAVASNPGDLARSLVWDWMRVEWAVMQAKGWASGNFVWGSIVGAATGHFDTEARALEITAFFADPAHPAGSAERTVKQNVESIRNRSWATHIVAKQAASITATLAAL